MRIKIHTAMRHVEHTAMRQLRSDARTRLASNTAKPSNGYRTRKQRLEQYERNKIVAFRQCELIERAMLPDTSDAKRESLYEQWHKDRSI